MTTPRKHRHADMIRRWLEDGSLEVETLWGDTWKPVENPNWCNGNEYRFKQKTICCGGLEFPEPMRVAPSIETWYWMPSVSGVGVLTAEYSWTNEPFDKRALERGFAHSTKEAAEQHAKALIALTEVK